MTSSYTAQEATKQELLRTKGNVSAAKTLYAHRMHHQSLTQPHGYILKYIEFQWMSHILTYLQLF